ISHLQSPTALSLQSSQSSCLYSFFFFTHTATTHIYTLSLHDALPISRRPPSQRRACAPSCRAPAPDPVRTEADPPVSRDAATSRDRKSTRLNSSHRTISYAVFCLKKKKQKNTSSAFTIY